MSKEHVIRAKLGKLLPELVRTVFVSRSGTARGADSLVPEEHVLRFNVLNQTVNKICRSCNGDWLNRDVEFPAEEALTDLILGKARALTAQDCQHVSTWAIKTAMVRGLVDAQPYPHAPEQFRWLKDNVLPLPNHTVFVGPIEFDAHSCSRQTKFATRTSGSPSQTITTRGHITAFTLGHLALVVTGFHGLGAVELNFETARLIEGKQLVQVWPTTGDQGLTFNVLMDGDSVIDRAAILPQLVLPMFLGEANTPWFDVVKKRRFGKTPALVASTTDLWG